MMNEANTARVSALPPSSGAGMDRVIARDPRKRWVKIGAGAAAAAGLAGAVWLALPRGFAVEAAELDISTVAAGTFMDALALRSTVVPLSSVYLDATEGGRVEEVLVRDGATVKKGELLFRLSNAQRDQEALARSADVAQQLANLSTMRAALAATKAGYQRDLSGFEYAVERAAKDYARQSELAAKGFVSPATLEEAADKLAQQKRLLEQTRADAGAEYRIREQSIKEFDAAITGLNNGLRLVRAGAEQLAVHAPVDGRVTGFQLQVGESVKPTDRVGRIDSLDRYKLQASVDEYYLNRISTGLKGQVEQGGKAYGLTVSQLNPQIKDGRFTMFLQFDEAAPDGLQPGKSLDTNVTLGQPSRALLLTDGAFYADSGGAWVFVLDADGKYAARRSVKLGRRAAGKVEVLGGLSAGERVIVSGYRRFGEANRLRLTR
jgi:HlyD family secretion protein